MLFYFDILQLTTKINFTDFLLLMWLLENF